MFRSGFSFINRAIELYVYCAHVTLGCFLRLEKLLATRFSNPLPVENVCGLKNSVVYTDTRSRTFTVAGRVRLRDVGWVRVLSLRCALLQFRGKVPVFSSPESLLSSPSLSDVIHLKGFEEIPSMSLV